MKRNLKIVEPAEKPLDMGPDLYAPNYERIRRTNWAKLHIRADRSAPVDIPDRPRVHFVGRG